MLSHTGSLLLVCINQNLRYKKRTWYDMPRSLDREMLKWKRKDIGYSRLDDVRGEIKREGYVRRWQNPRPHKKDGTWNGSYATGQLTWKGCCWLATMGQVVNRPSWSVAKKYWKAESKPTTRENVPKSQGKLPTQHGYVPYFNDPYQDLPPPSGPLTHEEIVKRMKKEG